ncbi:MAG: hypothetical protein EXS13_11190 [Planctomycetes bacterium]|nr:hypothetical protein [Planctomycetota bacterium]
MKRAKGGSNGSGAAAAAMAAAAPAPRSSTPVDRPIDRPTDTPIHGAQAASEAGGWFTVSRAAQLLALPLPRIFDSIRDGRLQVRFEPGRPGEPDKPLVTSSELKQKVSTSPNSAEPSPASPTAPAAIAVTELRHARLDANANANADAAAELAETRETLDAAEERLDAALKLVYERDVRIARLEAELAAHQKMREESDGFIRHLEARLDKTEERSDEKEKEIRRLAVGLGEARGEIKMLKPPDTASPPSPWRRRFAGAGSFLAVLSGAALLGYFAFRLARATLHLETGLIAAIGVALAWIGSGLVERLRRAQ